MSIKNLNFLFFYCCTLLISGTLFSQEMEFPEDKVKYTINIVQEECVVTIKQILILKKDGTLTQRIFLWKASQFLLICT